MARVSWASVPPPFQMDADSISNYNLADVGQSFYGVLHTRFGNIILHPGLPNVGDKDFTRGGNSMHCAANIISGGGGHGWVMLYVARDPVNQKYYAGFSLKKCSQSITITTRSGLNTVAFKNPPPTILDDDEAERIMPPTWALALQDYITNTLHTPVAPISNTCIII